MHYLHTSAILLLFAVASLVRAADGDTRIATWKDDRTAAFMLMFDDGWPGQVEVAIPELQKRGLTATFYMVPHKGEYKAYIAKWAEAEKGGGVVYGNHTLNNQGVSDLENARREIGESSRIIRDEMQPGGKPQRLLSFAIPNGPKGWKITRDETQDLLREFHLIERPPFADHGAIYHWKTTEEMTTLAETAIANKGKSYLIIHGIERIGAQWQDYWPLAQAVFIPLLDYLKARSDARDLWVTDHISLHQYETERASARVRALSVQLDEIQLELQSFADPELYDHPLTLVTSVPAHWHRCLITQGDARRTVHAVNGTLTFDAIPNGPPIILKSTPAPTPTPAPAPVP